MGSRRARGELWTLQVTKDSGGDGDLSSQGEETHSTPGHGPPVEAPLCARPGPQWRGAGPQTGRVLLLVSGARPDPVLEPQGCADVRSGQQCVRGRRASGPTSQRGSGCRFHACFIRRGLSGRRSAGVCVSGGPRGRAPASQRSFLLWEQSLGQVLVGGVDPTTVLPTGHWTERGQGDPPRGPPGSGPSPEVTGAGDAPSADPGVGCWGPE